MNQIPRVIFGYSKSGKLNSRIIVEDTDDQDMVRQYYKARGNFWYCLGCTRMDKKHFKTKGILNGGVFKASLFHYCHGQTKASALEEQDSIQQKFGIRENVTEQARPTDIVAVRLFSIKTEV